MSDRDSDSTILLSRHENQARLLGQYAIDFVRGGLARPNAAALDQLRRFHTDSVGCAIAALCHGCRAPWILREEAFAYTASPPQGGATCFGSPERVAPEKAVAANVSAVRELDANGTNFGYDPRRGAARGEFGHNDFYPVVMAASQQVAASGRQAALAMLCLDEIRGRLAEVFALRQYKIDHVLHGAIASAATYGALLGANAEQIESAIGLVVAHYVPFRAIRHGDQLSDSKGASAALAAGAAVLSVQRAMRGFEGPRDIFRNAQALFCLFEPPDAPGLSPFDLELGTGGEQFAVMGMHFKLGLYEHQSAGAIQAVLELLTREPRLADDVSGIERIEVTIYEPAYGIICDGAKRRPMNRQSADHSLYYIVATLLRKAAACADHGWTGLMLLPNDYNQAALADPLTERLMAKVQVRHGGPEFDARYPDGIPTHLRIVHARLGTLDSGLVMYPTGHARADNEGLDELLREKFKRLAAGALDDPDSIIDGLNRLAELPSDELALFYSFPIRTAPEASQ